MRSVEVRLSEHRKASNRLPVSRAWRKIGAPSVQVLAECSSQQEMDRLEAELIVLHGTMKPDGYNLCEGGRPCPSKNPEVAKRISEAQKGKIISAETRVKMSAAAKARVRIPWSNETRAKMAESGKRSWSSAPAEHTSKRGSAIRKSLKDRFANLTPEQRQAFSETRKRAWETRRTAAGEE